MLLPELVARAARATPDAIAVECDGARLSYEELESHSTDYAERLRLSGVGAPSIVAVAMTRTPHLLVALLGILKAGAAYLPVDPGLPDERRRFLLDDAGARIVLGDGTWSAIGDGSTAGTESSTDQAAPRVPIRGQQPDDLAYVIYTSGSTGQPKGVEITHAAVANFLESMRVTPGISPRDRVLAHTTISFDIHVLELWLPLVAGATVVLVDRDVAVNPSALARVLENAGVTLVQATPALWSLLLRAGWSRGAGVKALCGGEALRRDLADALLRAGVELWNMYGPTETTVWSTVWRVPPAGPILIGTPIARTTVHVLPTDLSAPLVERPTGEAGELCIGGAGLARGYRRRPDLTRERFVTMPGVGRVYRTGDLARRLADGTLEHLGRLDHQLKIAGHRIEPGEVEVALRRLSGVRDAAVIGVDDGSVSHRLVAYVVTDGPLAPSAMRAALAGTLPAYMIPTMFVGLGRFPLTPSGKVDRRALPTPVRPQVGEGLAAETQTESALVDLWCEVLDLPTVGVTDDFFDLGGHSRLGAFLLSLVAQRFGCTLPLPTLVEAPTIRRLARVVEDARGEGPRRTAPLIRLTSPGPERPTLFLVHAAGGHAVIYNALGRALAHDATIVVFQSRGFERPGPSATGAPGGLTGPRSVDDLASAYVRELTRLQPAGPYALGGASFGGLVAYEMARRLHERGDAVGLLVMFDTELPPLGLSPVVRRLARVPGFRARVYPNLRRAIGHVRAMARDGLSSYAAWMRRGGMRGLIAPDWRSRVGAGGDALLDGLARVRVWNERAMADYIPRAYRGRLVYCLARDVEPEAQDTRRRWVDVCPRTVYREVPGDHHTMLLAPQVEQLAVIVREELRGLAMGPGSAASHPRQPPLPPTPRPHAAPQAV